MAASFSPFLYSVDPYFRAILFSALFILLPSILLSQRRRKHSPYRLGTTGCKKLGIQGLSNLHDEEDAQFSAPSADSKVRIKALFVHPIKSCAPIEVDSAELASTGLIWDRQFCFAEFVVPTVFPPDTSPEDKKLPQWTFRTLRKPGYEKLTQVRTEVWVPDPTYTTSKGIPHPNPNGVLRISFPNTPSGPPPLRFLQSALLSLHLLPSTKSFSVPLLPPKNHQYPLETLSIWASLVPALDYGIHLPASLKSYLSIPPTSRFTLFRVSPEHYRPVLFPGNQYDPTNPTLTKNSVTAFADQHPMHLINLSSVRNIASLVAQDLPHFTARRFRPNIIVAGAAAFDEDRWKNFQITPQTPDSVSPPSSKIHFQTAFHTLRCRLPNVDPDTGVRHDVEPDRTLRAKRGIVPGLEKKAVMGLQVVCREEESGRGRLIHVGDEVEVLQRGDVGVF